MVGLHRPAAVGVLVAAEGCQQGRAERDEEDHEERPRRPQHYNYFKVFI